MELLLNLLWFVIAASALAAYVRASSSDHERFRLGLGALLCILTLLLPAISITDDLHFDTFAVEDSNSTKRLANAAAHANPMSQLVWFGISLLALLFATLRRTTWRTLESSTDPCPDSQFPRSVLGRAPPAVLA